MNNNSSSPEFSIDKALQFVGDNSSYQKRRLFILTLITLTFATLTCRISLYSPQLALIFLFASGAGQIVCPIYMSLRTIVLGLAGSCIIGVAMYPVSTAITVLVYLAIGFFGRGFFVASLIYLNQIGGDKFRAWSMVVIFGIWGLSPLVESFQGMFHILPWIWTYLFIFAPFLVGSYLVLKYWKPSPYHLYTKRLFQEAKQVLNDIAEENNRPSLPYNLEGSTEPDELGLLAYKKPTYLDLITRPILRSITIPLAVLWVYREYIYYGSYTILPELGGDIAKNLILLSISETVAVLMSYPIRLRVKRVNAFFGLALLICVCSLLSSFSTLSQECKEKGGVCATKYLYRTSIMVCMNLLQLIRFSIALIGNLLISYTLQIYPSNVRSLGFSLSLAISAIGSTLMPWINQTFIYIKLSGFISFAIASIVVLWFIGGMTETYGKMRMENLQEMERQLPIVSLREWATLRFQ